MMPLTSKYTTPAPMLSYYGLLVLFAHTIITTTDAWTTTTTTQLPTLSLHNRAVVGSTTGFLRRSTTTRVKDSSSSPEPPSQLENADADDETKDRISHEQSRRRWLNSVAYSVAILPAATPTKATAAPALVKSSATCDPSVSIWKRDDRIVYLLGTAHISSVSANLAGQLVKDIHPNAVFIELDLKRVGSLSSLAPSRGGDGSGAAGGDKKSRLLIPAISSTSTSVSSSSATTLVAESRTASASPVSNSPLLADDAATTSSNSLTTTTTQLKPSPRRGLFGGDPVGFGANMLGNALRVRGER